ncbi:MAG: hypothetical protein AAB461_03160, partial [Patescibacteria group bacterium]
TGNTLQVGGFSSAAYSRFGTTATTHSLSATNDLLINGKFEVDGSTYFDGTVNFTTIASASLFYAQNGTASSPSFSFAIDQDTGMFRSVINALGFSTLGVERLTITSAGNVGIGTTAPLTRFEVQGTASASNLLTVGSLQVANGGATVSYSRFGTTTTGHSNYISAANDLLISGDLETRGTASFGGVASVSGNFFTYGTNTFSGTGSSSFAGSLDISKGLRVGVNTALSVNANASANTLVLVGSNVGIGTATPVAKLNIAGDMQFTFQSSTNRTINIASNGINDPVSLILNGSDGTSDDGNVILATIGNVGIGTTAPTSLLTVQGRGEFQGTASASYLLTGNTLQVGGFASVAYSRFGTSTLTTNPANNWITASNDLLVSGDLYGVGSIAFAGPASISNTLFVGTGGKTGNVGIGTTTPFKKLIVSDTGTSNPTQGLMMGISIENTNITQSALSGVTFNSYDSGGTTRHLGAIVSGKSDSWTAADATTWDSFLSFWTRDNGGNEAERMRITADGNVGIGTTSPDSLLELSSTATNLIVRSTGSTSSASIDFQPAGGASSSNQGKFTIRAGGSAGTGGERLEFLNGAATPLSLMTIASSGNVGIGTTVPNPLGVASTIYGKVVTIAQTTAGARSLLELWSNVAPSSNQTIGQISFLSGTAPASGPAAAILSNSNGTTANTGDLQFWTSETAGVTTNRMRIMAGGNVGIKTTTPSTLFEVQGTASASYLLTGNTLQVGGFASAAYSRFGTSTLTTNPAGNWITASNDLLVSGDLYGVGSIAFAGPAS